MIKKKKLVFLTGTRAEFGKLKPLIRCLNDTDQCEVHLFVTGMHLLEKYGGTAREVLREFPNVYLYNNQAFGSRMDITLSNTIYGFGYYISEISPDLIIVHGDRVETLAGAIVGALNNILVAHIEGGELSGTIDELMRHSVTKLAHIHFVANEQAKKRIIQLGEIEENIIIIGSPDIDVMSSEDLPALENVCKHYNIDFDEHAILLYHPVTSELKKLKRSVKELIDAVIESGLNYVVIYPNNDPGCKILIEEYSKLDGLPNFKLFPSIQFESFLVLLKNAKFIIGNSSAGIREAPMYAIPTINLGSRQHNRFRHDSIFDVKEKGKMILKAITDISNNSYKFEPCYFFGNGGSALKFKEALNKKGFWDTKTQKQFLDLYDI
ncbi:MAG: UDP-N-acetylglucosamine 2-epimerase (hydrolyzing) [Planctomycetes bacterium]|nr:UDP-N-acetylglucosamine 2-epimerase (hydrolyzing) [Planctomycetota bacterium]